MPQTRSWSRFGTKLCSLDTGRCAHSLQVIAEEQAKAWNFSEACSFYRQVQGGIAMPTKRRVIIFLIVLAFMALVYRATAQELAKKEQPMQWRGPSGADSQAIEHAVYILMGGGIVFGGLVGGGRAIANKRRMKK
jgi:hypothetical protein